MAQLYCGSEAGRSPSCCPTTAYRSNTQPTSETAGLQGFLGPEEKLSGHGMATSGPVPWLHESGTPVGCKHSAHAAMIALRSCHGRNVLVMDGEYRHPVCEAPIRVFSRRPRICTLRRLAPCWATFYVTSVDLMLAVELIAVA